MYFLEYEYIPLKINLENYHTFPEAEVEIVNLLIV